MNVDKDRDVKHPDLLEEDHLCAKLTNLFAAKIGQPYSSDQLDQFYKEADQRYSQSIPPGFADSQKPAPAKYGDFIIWKQIIDLAKAAKKSVIFVTDDAKEDWWFKVHNRTFGPRPELIQEFFQQATTDFYMYPSDQFMEIAQQTLKIKQTDAAVKEIRQIREQDLATQALELEQRRIAFREPMHNPVDSLREMERQRRESLAAMASPMDSLREMERQRREMLAAMASPMDSLREMERQRRESLAAASPTHSLREIERQLQEALDTTRNSTPTTKQTDPPAPPTPKES